MYFEHILLELSNMKALIFINTSSLQA